MPADTSAATVAADMFPGEPSAATRLALASMVARHATPGVQYVFADLRGRRFGHAAGLAHVTTGNRVDGETTFNAYSVAKTLTAAALVVAARQGRLDLDAPIESLLGIGAWRGFGSLRQTLLHRGGFPNPNPLRWIHDDAVHRGFDEAGFVRRVAADLQAPGRVGDRYRYSNVGYLMLGVALERATGLALPEFVQRHLVAPLNALPGERLAYAIPVADAHARGCMARLGWMNMALGLFADRSRLIDCAAGRWVQFRLHHVDGAAYGGLLANAAGLVRYGLALLDRAGPFDAALRESMLTVVPGPGPARSLGWFCGQLQGTRWFAHAGGGPAYYCELRLYPERGAVSAIMFNRPGLRDARVLDGIDRWLLAA